ncbi:hypothetical protein [Neobacillus sp. LXY-1]|uniref:hypothetical protein n=1 Tax=Neobacillus sp. LXY-1 TaxID=3379133 RepID=UPI003EE3B60C
MKLTDFTAIFSVIISLLAFFYTFKSNTKKYELSSSFRKELVDWFTQTIRILIELKLLAKANERKSKYTELLAKLSAQIEIGRLYFPNINKSDKFGEDKPIAYQGYRNVVLEFLVLSYRIFDKEDANKYVKHAEYLQREFTSQLFEVINPTRVLNDVKKLTSRTFTTEYSFEDFLSQNPDSYKNFNWS